MNSDFLKKVATPLNLFLIKHIETNIVKPSPSFQSFVVYESTLAIFLNNFYKNNYKFFAEKIESLDDDALAFEKSNECINSGGRESALKISIYTENDDGKREKFVEHEP